LFPGLFLARVLCGAIPENSSLLAKFFPLFVSFVSFCENAFDCGSAALCPCFFALKVFIGLSILA
jgi:hypothetical protein